MKYRKVTGSERDSLLSSRKPSGFNYLPYVEILDSFGDADVVAVEVADEERQRGEKIRFSRAARMRGKSLTWLTPDTSGEIAFQIGPARQKRPREKRPA